MMFLYIQNAFHRMNDDGNFQKLGMYLPAAPGTYGEPINTTIERWINQLNSTGQYYDSGRMLSPSVIGGCCQLIDGKFVPVEKQK